MSDLARIRAALAGRYIIERELGAGGMATVYLARDLKHGRHVALKVLGTALAGSAGTERFLREIRTTARLTHPAILPLYDSGEVTGVPFYTMPWVDGETLRELMDRERGLPVDRACEIAAAVSDALAYAHDAGITHRDIKPENILLSRSGHVWVADFGLAHALAGAANVRLSSGMAVGSPHYMSPEQALGQESTGPASDVYSLGCVIHEMLTGAAPFQGPAASVLARHITETPPDISSSRADSPAHIAALVKECLAKDPGARPSARAVNAVLEGKTLAASGSKPVWQRRPRAILARPKTLLAAAAAVVLVLALSTVQGRRILLAPFGSTVAADTTSYAVMPFSGDSSARGADIKHLLNEALGQWGGISLADPLRVADVETQKGKLSFKEQAQAAIRLGASRFVTGEVKREGSEIHVHARVYDARKPKRSLTQAFVRIPVTLENAEAMMSVLADSLLFHGAGSAAYAGDNRGTRSVPALRAYLAAHAALREWETARADSQLTVALRHDGKYAQAQLWLAQIRQWTGKPRSEWRGLAEQAVANSAGLNPREKILAAALNAMGMSDLPRACALYSDLTSEDPNDFVAQYGLGECLRRDATVIPDSKSPSGWSFRTSAGRSIDAYRRAYELLPAIHKIFGGNAFEVVRRNFYTSQTTLRDGRNEAEVYFLASPAWVEDTLAFIPVSADITQSESAARPASSTLAVRKTRALFREVTATWVRAYPTSAAALEAEAVALEMLGADSALSVYRAARRAAQADSASDRDRALHLLVSELWVRLKHALPSDTIQIHLVTKTADSLLTNSSIASPKVAQRLASLAALTGRANRAAQLSRAAAIPERGSAPVSIDISAPAGALLAFAAMNGPVDSIRTNEWQVEQAITNTFEQSERDAVRATWTIRAATMAFPAYRSAVLTPQRTKNDYLGKGQVFFMAGDTGRAGQTLDNTAAARAQIPPAGWKPDALYPEAWLIAQFRGPRAAGELLCPMLESIRWSDPGTFNDVPAAGTLPLAMLLYSQALRETGATAEAARWRRAVAILWSRADSHLQNALRSPRSGAGVSASYSPATASSCFPGGR